MLFNPSEKLSWYIFIIEGMLKKKKNISCVQCKFDAEHVAFLLTHQGMNGFVKVLCTETLDVLSLNTMKKF